MEDVKRRIETIISEQGDLSRAVRTAREEAIAAGFTTDISEEIALVVSELTSNLLKHAEGGRLIISHLNQVNNAILRIDAINKNRVFNNLENALRDGYSTTKSLGFGLGTVNRLMDTIEILASDTGETVVRTQRKVRSTDIEPSVLNLDIGVASITHPLMKENGDSFFIKRWKFHALCGVIDGLGHGREACRAALSATQYVQTHYDLPMDQLFKGVQYACMATRGVVMGAVRFDKEYTGGDLIMSHASVGNIETRKINQNGISGSDMIICRGILGTGTPNPVITTHQVHEGTVVVLFSDGISPHWKKEEGDILRSIPASDGARYLLRHYWLENDDATAMVIKMAEP